jgi:hypothetical protein
MSNNDAADHHQQPAFRIVSGEPDAGELAALTVVLLARTTTAAQPSQQQRPSGWAAYWRQVGAPLAPGPGSWQAAARGW